MPQVLTTTRSWQKTDVIRGAGWRANTTRFTRTGWQSRTATAAQSPHGWRRCQPRRERHGRLESQPRRAPCWRHRQLTMRIAEALQVTRVTRLARAPVRANASEYGEEVRGQHSASWVSTGPPALTCKPRSQGSSQSMLARGEVAENGGRFRGILCSIT